MKPIGEIEEDLAEKTEPILGFKPSSKFKRGPVGILIYIICGVIAYFSSFYFNKGFNYLYLIPFNKGLTVSPILDAFVDWIWDTFFYYSLFFRSC